MIWSAPRLAIAALILLAGCGPRGEPAPGAVPEVALAVPQRPDTLVLALPGGNTVWLAEGRADKDSAGAPCFERSVEIRHDSVKLKVPLLYTAAAPTRVNDTIFLATLYQNCRPQSAYKVGVRDGMPHKVVP